MHERFENRERTRLGGVNDGGALRIPPAAVEARALARKRFLGPRSPDEPIDFRQV